MPSLATGTINEGENVQQPHENSKKRRKNPPSVLKDITNISQILVTDKVNIQSKTDDGTCEDHVSEDEDADMDNNIRGSLIYYLAFVKSATPPMLLILTITVQECLKKLMRI